MTQFTERSNLGDKAFHLIDQNRNKIDDHFRIEPLEVEFPYTHHELTRQFGKTGLFLARAGDNEAGTFKTRGAFVGAAALQEQGASALRVASAGNHARGSIIAARELGFSCIHVGVPATAPVQKREALYDLWQSPRLKLYIVGNTYDATMEWINDHPDFGTLLHPYDDPNVIAGQGTIADDIIAELPEVNVIAMPVGGGGLLAGIRQRLDERDRHDVITYGIEAEGSNSASQSRLAGNVVEASAPNPRYGGSQVRKIGKHAFAVHQSAGDRVRFAEVTDHQVATAMALYQQTRVDLWRHNTPAYEPTSIVPIAGLEKVIKQHPNEVIVVIGTGHNAPLPRYI